MANDALSQQALAQDPAFRRRVKGALAVVAWQQLNQNTTDPKYSVRANYARVVIANLDSAVANVVGWLVMRPNLLAFATTAILDAGVPGVVTASGDADIQSQIGTDWDFLAGITP